MIHDMAVPPYNAFLLQKGGACLSVYLSLSCCYEAYAFAVIYVVLFVLW